MKQLTNEQEFKLGSGPSTAVHNGWNGVACGSCSSGTTRARAQHPRRTLWNAAYGVAVPRSSWLNFCVRPELLIERSGSSTPLKDCRRREVSMGQLPWPTARTLIVPRTLIIARASIEEVLRIATELGLASYTEFVKGWFDQTLPTNRDRIGPIALLRIDCDWYSSVMCCLDNLYDQVADRGFVVLDDYYTWDGCAIAVHEFLGQTWPLQQN